MMSYFFNWYHGQIWPNIIASVLTGAFVFIATHFILRLLHKQHVERTAQHLELLNKINKIGE